MKLRHAVLPFALLCAVPSLALAERGFEVRDLASLDRVSAPTLSPDGGRLVFAVREADLAANKASTGLWLRDLRTRDQRPPQRLTPPEFNVNSPAFAPDGKAVYFLSAKNGTQQVWAMPAQPGATPTQVTDYPLDVSSFKLAPDGKALALSVEVFADCGAGSEQDALACTKGRLDAKAADEATGVVYDKMFVRHWDTWADGRRSQLFTAALGADGKAGATAWVSKGLDGDVPSKPFGDAGEYTWAPDGKTLVLSLRVAGTSEPWSTNFDLFQVSTDGSTAPKNLTEANKAWDTGPLFSADGKTLYYRAMKRPGFEADRFAIMAMDLGTGATREVAPRWDASAGELKLSPDGKRLYTTADELGAHPLFAVRLDLGEVEAVAGEGTVEAFDVAGDTVAFTRNSLQSPAQAFVARADGRAVRPISVNNADKLADIAFGAFEQFTFIGWNDETVHGYVVKPWNYEEGKKYPVAFLIHGGPQGSFGNGWSYRWNPQTYAGQGYAAVMIDFHGSTGYGQAFTDAISQHWGDRPLEDLQKGWAAALKKYPFLDGDKGCALGASYGGYMVNWIAGNWFDERGSSPWKCLVNHDGVFDTRMMGYATEELWFTEWENGGTPYQVPENYEQFNPANHVKDWRVPMLVVQGELDYRIPVSQGLGTFTALQRKGIESKLLYFPDENHWVLKPANSVRWHDTVNAWLKQHLGQ